MSLGSALESLADFFELEEPRLVPTRHELTHTTVPVNSLRYSPGSQEHVFAPGVRAREVAIHLETKYGDDWKKHLDEIHSETSEVMWALGKIKSEDIVIRMTADNVPVVSHGFHKVCAYRNRGYSQIEVALGMPYRETSDELSLRTFDQLTVYPHFHR